MNDNDKETTAIVIRPDAPLEWGRREEIAALADRLAVMLPNRGDFDRNEVMAAAQYCRMMDVNPFRGEVYFYKSRGKLVVVDGYKVLARWANDKSPYSERFEIMEPGEGEIHHMRCWILRDDRKGLLKEFIDLGATWREAYEAAASFADGIVTGDDLVDGRGRSRTPPTGWDWEQVARKRALKNALNLSHGAPSPREIAKTSWNVNGTETIAEDWIEALQTAAPGQEAEMAAKHAHFRTTNERIDNMTPEELAAAAKDASDALFGDHPPDWDDEVFESNVDEDTGEIVEPEPEPESDIDPVVDDMPIPEWYKMVMEELPHYRAIKHIKNALEGLMPEGHWFDNHSKSELFVMLRDRVPQEAETA